MQYHNHRVERHGYAAPYRRHGYAAPYRRHGYAAPYRRAHSARQAG